MDAQGIELESPDGGDSGAFEIESMSSQSSGVTRSRAWPWAGEAEEARPKSSGRDEAVKPREMTVKSAPRETPGEESHHELASVIATNEGSKG